jgi:hypothetical protein
VHHKSFFATKFAHRDLLFSKLSLISIGKGGGGVPQNFLDSKNHLAVPSGTSELSTPSIPLRHKQTRKYDDNYLVNSTALLRPSRPGFLSIRQRASVFNDRLLFSTHFHLAVGVRGFGVRENRGHLVSRITTVRRARVRRYHMAALHNSDFLYMLLLPKNASRSFGGYMFQPRYYTSPWRLTRGVSTRLRLLLLVIITYFKVDEGEQGIYGCGSCWLVSQVAAIPTSWKLNDDD